MKTPASSADRVRSVLILAATLGVIAFNALASAGRVNGVTLAEISDKYPTVITPAGYAFAIWSLIYAGLLIFSILQMLPGHLARYRSIRSVYILSCALNCAWIFFWHSDQIAICLAIIVFLLGTLIFIAAKIRVLDSATDNWLVKGPF